MSSAFNFIEHLLLRFRSYRNFNNNSENIAVILILKYHLHEYQLFLITLPSDVGTSQNRGPGKDYPTYAEVPDTSFSCKHRSHGFYADPEAECQVRCHAISIKFSLFIPIS